MRPTPISARITALILDLDGTLLRGNELIPGVVELCQYLATRQMPCRIASNNATRSPSDYQQKLAHFGVRFNSEHILTAGIATAAILQRDLQRGAKIYVIGETALKEALIAAGFSLQEDASTPVAAVVVGGDSHLTYDKLKLATLLLQRGARFIGTNPDLLYPTEEGLVPEAGTTIAALRAATGRTPTIIGKPERHLFDLAVSQMKCAPANTAVVGDRLETDILGGQQAGLKTILTTTGVDNEASIQTKTIYPDWVANGPIALIELLKSLDSGE